MSQPERTDSIGTPSEAPPGPAGGGRPEPVHPLPPSPFDEAPARETSNLAKRIGTAAVLIPFVLWIISLGGLAYLAIVLGFVLLGIREVYVLIEEKGAHPLWGFGLAAGGALPIVAYVGNEYHATILMTAGLLAMMVAQLGKAQLGEALSSISGTFFGVFYVGWLLSHTVVLRNFHDVVIYKMGAQAGLQHAAESGAYYMVFGLTVLVAGDAGAYFTGRAYGKRKLAPKISPKKTVEGAIGGVLTAVFAGLVTKAAFDFRWPELSQGFGWTVAAIFGFTLAVVGMIGDLVESLLKRDAKVKDAGALLPGMGGVLDRIDAPLLGIPVLYYMLLAQTYLELNLP